MVQSDMFAHKLCALLDRNAITNRDIFDCWYQSTVYNFGSNKTQRPEFWAVQTAMRCVEAIFNHTK